MNLSIKNVPETLMKRLRASAERNRRSLQGELLVLLQAAVEPKQLTLEEARMRIIALGLETDSDSETMVREDRDAR